MRYLLLTQNGDVYEDIVFSNTFLTHSGKRLFLGTKSNHNRESNAPKIKMISGAVLRSDDGGIWP